MIAFLPCLGCPLLYLHLFPPSLPFFSPSPPFFTSTDPFNLMFSCLFIILFFGVYLCFSFFLMFSRFFYCGLATFFFNYLIFLSSIFSLLIFPIFRINIRVSFHFCIVSFTFSLFFFLILFDHLLPSFILSPYKLLRLFPPIFHSTFASFLAFFLGDDKEEGIGKEERKRRGN